MAGQPPKRYNPGELQKTRERLGNLSTEEARRMARRLGGEVGVERAEDRVETGYQKLSDLNRRRSDRYLPPEPQRGGAVAPPSSESLADRNGGDAYADRPGNRPGYFDLLRMNFLAARPEHGIKSLSNAIVSIFSPFAPSSDLVSARFLRYADREIFSPIESLVLGVRQLLARNAKSPAYRLQNPLLEEILSAIKDWDIEGMSRELARLQRDPRGVTFADCRRLCVMVYRPIVRLEELDPTYHIAAAIKHLHDLDLLTLPKQSSEAGKVRLQYASARDSLIPVFRRIRQICYPLLLKLASPRFIPYPDLLRGERSAVLALLSLTPDEIIRPKELPELLSPQGGGAGGRIEGTAPEGQGAEPQRVEEPTPPPDAVTRAMELLDQLFPDAGFARLAEYPDLYPFFQPLFTLPRGMELIPPEDPVHQVVILLAVLQALFYGFRSIRFRSFYDERGAKVAVNETIDSLTGNWHVFLDEVIGKNYAASLDEVCRQLERNRDFLSTDYGDKLEADLQWIKRRFLLPRLPIRASKSVRPAFASTLPQLPETVRDLAAAIDLVLKDVESGRSRSIENPWEEFTFAIEDFVSKRVRLILSRRANPEQYLGKRLSNVSLMFHAWLVLQLLEYLVTSPDSFYYKPEAHPPLFRAEPGRPGVPQYVVRIENPYEIIAAAEQARNVAEKPAPPSQTNEVALDPITRMAGLRELTLRMETLTRNAQQEDHPFVLLAVALRRLAMLTKERGVAYTEQILKATAGIIEEEIRQFADLPFRVGMAGFVVLLPDTGAAEAAHLARRVAKRFAEAQLDGDATPSAGPIEATLAIVERRKGLSVERHLKLTEEAIRAGAKLPSPSIVTLDENNQIVPAPPQE